MLQNLGRVGFVFEGDWTSGETYKPLSVVRMPDASLWTANKQTLSEPGNDDSWTMMFPSPLESISSYQSLLVDGDRILESNGQFGITVKKGVMIAVGSDIFRTDSDMVVTNARTLLDTGSAFTAGKDYYVYLCKPTGQDFKVVISLNATFPNGMTADNSRKIGGFHCLCVAAGTLPSFTWGGQTINHPLTGFAVTAILPQSVWDLKNRAECENEGMIKSSLFPMWTDIYLMSGTGYNTASRFGGAITRSREYHLMVEEDLISVKKRPLFSFEFTGVARGSNEMTSVAGASSAGATDGGAGGRLDTAGRRMLSADGNEEMNGSLWQVLADQSAAGDHRTKTDTYFYGRMPDDTQGNIVGEASPHPQEGGRGGFWYMCTVLLAGGNWSAGSGCGSSSRYGHFSRSSVYSSVGSRGCASSRAS